MWSRLFDFMFGRSDWNMDSIMHGKNRAKSVDFSFADTIEEVIEAMDNSFYKSELII